MAEKKLFGESSNVEFKREIPARHEKLLKDIIAFSNCSGGKVVIGIEDGTNIVYGIGDQNPFRLSDAISNMISDACEPQIDPSISVQTLDDQTVLVIDVAPGRYRPYYLKAEGRERSSYIRINGTSRPADSRKIQELELEGRRISYDTLPCIGADYNFEEAEKLCRLMRMSALKSCQTEEEKAQIKPLTTEKLEDFGLLTRRERRLYPTNGYQLLLGKGPYYARIQCALFKGLERDIFIDRKEFQGPLHEQITDAYQFVLKHLSLGAEISGLYRRDIYEIPAAAVREAIVNAVMHRSYLDESCIQISIFDDRVEILSPGMLYDGLDWEAAKSGRSKCRNAAIAEAFRYMRIVERWGTGIPRIIRQCREYGLPGPLFEESGDSVRIILYRRKSNSEGENPEIETESPKEESESPKIETESPKIRDESPIINQDKTTKVIENQKAIEERMLWRLRHYMLAFASQKNITKLYKEIGTGRVFGRNEIMGILGCSKSTAANLLNEMKKAEVIEKVPGRGKYVFSSLKD